MTSSIKNALKIGVATFLLWPNVALAQLDYCTLSERVFEVHLFGESYSSKEEQAGMIKGLDIVTKNLEMGDEIKIHIHRGGELKTIKMCLPGCPDQGLVGNLLQSECSAQVAKKDTVAFKKKYASSVKSALGMAGNSFDIFDHFSELETYYRQRDASDSNRNVYVFHTTVPYDVNPEDKNTIDKFFVETIQNGKQASISLPKIPFVNSNRSKAINDLWNDLALDGHKDGFEMNASFKLLD